MNNIYQQSIQTFSFIRSKALEIITGTTNASEINNSEYYLLKYSPRYQTKLSLYFYDRRTHHKCTIHLNNYPRILFDCEQSREYNYMIDKHIRGEEFISITIRRYSSIERKHLEIIISLRNTQQTNNSYPLLFKHSVPFERNLSI
jgi:hypothetical protein